MGSYAKLRLGSFHIGSTKDGIDPSIMTLFRESDKRVVEATSAHLELQHSFSVDELGDNDSITIVQYACSTTTARDRLELMGFTRELAEAGFYQGLKTEITRYEEWVEGSHGDIFAI